MLRLNPPQRERLETSTALEMRIGGSESNTAVALTRLGRRTAWFSRLPNNPLGHRIARELRGEGVDVSRVRWTDSGRVGTYYIEYGASPRPHRIVYDRAHSAASTMSPEDLERVLEAGAAHLHVSGITPALSSSCAELTSQAVIAARANGMSTSFDINFRAKLWDAAVARQVLAPMLSSIDLVICSFDDAETVLGLSGTPEDRAASLCAVYGCGAAVLTCGADGAVGCSSGHILRVDTQTAVELDRVGAGDAFAAGVIDGFLADNLLLGLQQGAAMAALKHTIHGDHLTADRDEIDSVVHGKGSNAIQR